MGPADLEDEALELFQSPLVPITSDSQVGQQTKNILAGKYRIVTTPRLSDVDAWYLADTRRPIKRMIYQQRLAPTLLGKYYDYKHDSWDIPLKFRGRFVVGKWQTIYGQIPA